MPEGEQPSPEEATERPKAGEGPIEKAYARMGPNRRILGLDHPTASGNLDATAKPRPENRQNAIIKTADELYGPKGPDGTLILTNKERDADDERLITDKHVQAKLISSLAEAMKSGNWDNTPQILSAKEATVSENDRDAVTEAIRDGRVDRAHLKHIISQFKRPIDDARILQDIFEYLNDQEIDPSLHQLALVAYLRGKRDIKARYDVTPGDLIGLGGAYPTPFDIEEDLEAAIAEITQYKPEKIEPYQHAANNLQETLYGEQFEYSQQAKQLVEEARQL